MTLSEHESKQRLAAAWVSTGDARGAVEWARQMPSPHWRGHMRAAILDALLDRINGEPPEGGR